MPVVAGPPPSANGGALNPPIQRVSTVIFPTMDAYIERHKGLYDDVIYGLYGTETSFALAEAIARLENGRKTLLTGSGTSAIAQALSAFVSAGDHVLVADNVYGPTRRFCGEVLSRFGVVVAYFDPLRIDALVPAIQAKTRVIYLESPGSQTFEMTDVPAIATLARARGIKTIVDNTWASPLFFKPILAGVDVSLASATKYLSGHSDVLMGALTTADEATFRALKDSTARWGEHASPDDCYLVHRGLRTLAVRMARHQENALTLANWLAGHPEVMRVLCPALPSDPGHAIWKRDFRGASGLFGVILKRRSHRANAAMCDHFRYFKLGSSWGGFESLMVPSWPPPIRNHGAGPIDGDLFRIHAGLEDVQDLIGDLDRALAHRAAYAD
ncbi:MAG: cystathionine beta-lyase [Rhodospirillaceae bacterium]|nr:cystathionine beta-lyase [Rhodospirillaceae bacterium]